MMRIIEDNVHVIAGIGGLVLAIVVYLVSGNKKKEEAGLRRRMSFTSAACAEGPMPDHAKMQPEAPIINACILLKAAPTRTGVEEAITPLFKYERFRSRKVKVDGSWCFEVLDPPPKASHHVVEEEFSGTVDDLFKRLEKWAQKPLHVSDDDAQFEFAILKNTGKGPSAVIARVNHAVGDGIALARLIPIIFKDAAGQELPSVKKFTRKEKGFKPTLMNPLSILSSLLKVINTPNTAYDSDIGLTDPDKKHIVFTGRRVIVKFPTLKLSFIKALKNACAVTVNDVIYAAIAGAIHRYRADLKDELILDPESDVKVQTRVLLPVALPRKDRDPTRALRNKWSFASVPMPVGVKGSIERLKAANKIMSELKNSPTVGVQHVFETVVGSRLPWSLTKQVAYDTFTRHSMVFSNVPGPEVGVSFAGKEIDGLYMVYSNLIPQFGALSCNGKIYMCLVLDDLVTKDAQKLSNYFIDELMDLAQRSKLSFGREDIFG